MKKTIALFAITMIVFASGCILGGDSTPTFTRGYGLQITNFSSSLGTIYSGQTTHISMRVQNDGDSKILQENGLALLIIPSDWELINQEVNQLFDKDISFADSSKGTDAGSEYFTWSVKSPQIGGGITRPDTIRGRVFYDYDTKATGSIMVYPESEMLADNQAGRAVDSSSFTYSRGPIQMSISVVPDPVSVYSAPEVFSVSFKLTNVGGGVVYRADTVTSTEYGISDENRNTLKLDADIVGLTIDKSCFENIQFFGNVAEAICDVTVATTPMTKKSYPINVTASYGYYVEDTLDVNIIGRD